MMAARQTMSKSRYEAARDHRHQILPRQVHRTPRDLAGVGLGPGNHGNSLPDRQVRVILGTYQFSFFDGCQLVVFLVYISLVIRSHLWEPCWQPLRSSKIGSLEFPRRWTGCLEFFASTSPLTYNRPNSVHNWAKNLSIPGSLQLTFSYENYWRISLLTYLFAGALLVSFNCLQSRFDELWLHVLWAWMVNFREIFLG
jgi:hypothetical protein